MIFFFLESLTRSVAAGAMGVILALPINLFSTSSTRSNLCRFYIRFPPNRRDRRSSVVIAARMGIVGDGYRRKTKKERRWDCRTGTDETANRGFFIGGLRSEVDEHDGYAPAAKGHSPEQSSDSGYTFRMSRASLTFTLLLVTACTPSVIACAQSANSPFPLGTVLPRVATIQNPQQTFALYLPRRYSAENRWPIVYVFDPLARGEFAVRQFEQAAELHGFVVAASNNSRNGPWPPQFEAAQAMVSDTQQRFSIDTRRIYFAGFSGGARLSSQLALLCKCAAGALLSGAGFPHNATPSRDAKFAVFTAIGNADFNYSEVVPLQEQFEKATLPHWLRVFDGAHEWAPPEVLDEALAWFRLQAMKSNLEERDIPFIATQYRRANERAVLFEQSGDRLALWREYRQATATFDSLTDDAVFRSKAESAGKEKTLRDYLKREQDSFEEQFRLSEQVLSAISASVNRDSASAQTYSQSAEQLARALRQRSLSEKRLERALILKRAIGAVFVGAIESGNAAFEKKEYGFAAQYFACAAEANPESEAIFRQLAVTRAFSGERKGAIEALRSARKLTKDVESFSNWCKQENALAELRDVAACKAVPE